MKIKLVPAVLLTILLVFLCSCGVYQMAHEPHQISIYPSESGSAYRLDAWEEETFELVNDYRENKGLNRLIENEGLCQLARIRAIEAQISWGHYGPNSILNQATGESYCPDCGGLGENLARDFNTPQATLGAWIDSPAHKEILEGGYTWGCIGASRNGNRIYTTLITGRKE